MTLNGATPLSASSIVVWQRATTKHVVDFYSTGTDVTNVTTIIDQTAQNPPSRRLKEGRRLQSNTLTLTFDQLITYRTTVASVTAEQVIQAPFISQSSQAAYLVNLRNTGDPAFANLQSVSAITFPNSGGGGLSTSAIIGIAVGGAAGLLLLLVGGYYCFRNKDRGAKQGYSNGVSDDAPIGTVKGRMNDESDDISTLADPTTDKLSGRAGIGGYGDQSVATVDYDYSKAYGMGGEASVVSSSGGTFGSGTHGGQTTLGDLNPTGATASAAGFLDDGSFGNAAFRDPNAATTKEVFLDIYAPPGKLGVVIDTPDDGAPVVHAIKDSSVIANKLQVGDKLVAVDDEDVRTMTAINVSKLISRKSANATRKLSVIRTTVVRN